MATEDTLAKVELFSELERNDLERLAKVTVVRNYNAGDVIVKEGEMGVAFYVVAKGRVEVVHGAGTPDEHKIGELGPDDFFGEMSLLDNSLRSATVKALEATECLVLTRWDFNAELQAGSCQIALAMLGVLARRIRTMNEHAPTH